ncbi:MAG: PDR/VanB family oxidoreductase [Rhodoferax sp.]|uniref:PDR/VanB family oxidoreductase n=1 Tax=Rhodoferax sp. TaxID=50421 RepID=UPI0032677EEB
MSTIHVRVARKTVEALDICSYELVAVDGAPLPAFSAGSHIDVHMPGGLTRPYSLCNDPTETQRYRIGVLRDPASRGGSQAMHAAVNEGDVLEISPPKNHFALSQAASRSLLLAGGIGITPILAMAQTLAAQGAPLEMHYCSRTEERMAFRAEIARAAFARDVHFHFDDGSSMQKLSLPDLLAEPQPGVHLYVCGPTGFMDAVLQTARGSGWPEDQLHYEFFSANVAPSADDASFEVKLARSGRVVRIAADQTVAKALALAGVDIPLSCEQGVCGTCLTKVLEGEPDHKDFYLTPEEQAANDQFTPCCSRSKSALLVLDL